MLSEAAERGAIPSSGISRANPSFFSPRTWYSLLSFSSVSHPASICAPAFITSRTFRLCFTYTA